MSELEALDRQLEHLRAVLQHTGQAISMAEQRRSLLLRAAEVQRAVSSVYGEPTYQVEPETLKALGEGGS